MSDDYTEGPWIVDGLLVRAEENNEIICRIEPWSEDTDAADARLIAAAPMMFEYIKERASSGDPAAVSIVEKVNGPA